MNHIAIGLEHVDLLDTCNGLHGKLLHRSLQLQVVTAGNRTLRLLHHLAAWRTLTACAYGTLQFGQLLLVNRHVVDLS